MNPSREEALFALALERPVDQRPAFLEVVCADDSALRARLEALLAAHDAEETLLVGPEAVRLRQDASARPAQPTIPIDLAAEPYEVVQPQP